MTDDALGDLDPQPWLDRVLFTPDLNVGRLVETDAQIIAQIDAFLLSPGLDADALVAGYDFLSDGTDAVQSELQRAGGTIERVQPAETWGRAALVTAFGTPRDLVSINAHYDHQGLLTAQGNQDLANAGSILDVGDDDFPSSFAGSLLFTMGCHAGVSVPDSYAGSRTTDWADSLFARSAAVYVANYGYGYGAVGEAALSERLMTLFAAGVADGRTAGEAWRLAKQEYVATQGRFGSYDEKVPQQAIFYGLPMYRVEGAQAAAAAPSVTAAAELQPDPRTGSAAVPAQTIAAVSPSFATRTLDDGSTYPVATAAYGPTGQPYPDAESGAIVLHGYPIQPKVITEVTVDGYEARGAVIESMSSVPPVEGADIADPAYARAIVDLAANEPEVEPGSVIFPTAFQTVTHSSDGATSTDRLLLFPGQLTVDGPDATQLLFTNLKPTVYYVADVDPRAEDRTRPQILESTAGSTGDVVRFRVVARDMNADGTDGTGVARIVVLYNDRTNPNWVGVDLLQVGATDEWVGALRTANTGGRYIVQVADGAGNVGLSSRKGTYYEADGASPNVAVLVDGTPGNQGWYQGPDAPTVTLTGSSVTVPPAGLSHTTNIDGGTTSGYTGPFALPDGTYVLGVQGPGGPLSLPLKVDTAAPAIAISPSIGGNNYQPGQAVAVTITCTEATSGVAGFEVVSDDVNGAPATTEPCSFTGALDTTVDTGATARSITATAVDIAGNLSSETWTFTVSDTIGPVFGPYTGPGPVEATGPATPVTFATPTASDNVDPVVEVECVPPSGDGFPVGITEVTCTATDDAGNTATLAFDVAVVDTTAPVLTVPTDIVVDAASAIGASVSFVATATDAVDGAVTPVCTPASGSTFAIGTTTVTCTATDAALNTVSRSFTVTVRLLYRFSGFFQPIDMERADVPLGSDGVATVVNVANGGRNVPLKFQVFAPDGSVVSDTSLIWLTSNGAGSPAFMPSTQCAGKPRVPLEKAGGGSGSLKFAGGQFNIGITTPSPSTTTCYEFRAAIRGANGQPIGGITALVEVQP